MKYISFLVLVIFLLVGFANAEDRPTIIFLMTDDQRCDNLACYGRPEFKTPKIEELYDLETDSYEQHNLVDDPEFAQTLAELRQQTEAMYAAALGG